MSIGDLQQKAKATAVAARAAQQDLEDAKERE